MGRCRPRKESCRDVVSLEEIRLSFVDYSKKKGKEQHRMRRNSCKEFSTEKIKGEKVSIRRVTDDKYERTVGDLGLNRENIKELL